MSPADSAVADEKRRGIAPETGPRPALAFEIQPKPALAPNVMPFERSGATPVTAGTARPPLPPLSPAITPPAPSTPSEVATLQAAYGNAAITRAAAAGAISTGPKARAAPLGAVPAEPSSAALSAPPAPAQPARTAEIPATAPAAIQATAPSQKPVSGPASKAAAAGAEPITGKLEVAVAPGPHQAMAPVISAIRHRAAGARKHSKPPKLLVESAEDAGKIPRVEGTRHADRQTITVLDAIAQETEKKGESFHDAFVKQLEKAIDLKMTKTPATESEADEVRETGAKNANDVMQKESVAQSKAVLGPLKAAANPQEQPPDDSPAPPIQSEQLGPPPAPVSAASVVPAPLPAERFDFSSDHAPTDQVMAENNVTKEQLEEGNDPAFGPTLEAHAAAEKHEASIEARYRQGESKVQGNALGAAQHALAQGLGGIHGARKTQIDDVSEQQRATRDKNEAERGAITAKITGIKNETLGQVNRILNNMETAAVSAFKNGLKSAEEAYDEAFKEARGGRLSRAWNWATKWRGSWREHIENLLKTAREAYDKAVRRAINYVAGFVEEQLTNARQCVAKGLKDLEEFRKGLDHRAQEIAKDAITAVAGDFEAMVKDIDHRSEGLIDKLSQQYKASHERMTDMEEKLRQENKPLWERVYDATVGVIKKINELKDMLLDILGRAVSAIWDIIKHPIRFLETLVSGVGDGLDNFIKKIDVYLQQGIFAWLLGENVRLPEKFDLAGVSSIVLQILHIDPDYFRARAVSLVGERVVTTLEQGAEEFQIVRREGIPGLRRLAHQHLTDLKSMVVDTIWGFIKNSVIGAGIEFVLKLLTPASAFIAACKAIYEIVVFIVRRASQLKDLVSAVIDSIAAIAKGDASSAASRVEGALARAIPVAIGFLASLVGLGDPAPTVRSIINKARSVVDRAIDAVINLAMKGVKAAGKFVAGLFGGKKEEKKAKDEPATDPAKVAKVQAGLAAIDQEEKGYLEDKEISRENAEKVAEKVRHNNPVFTSLTVVDGGRRWDYQYTASPTETHGGIKKHPTGLKITSIKIDDAKQARKVEQARHTSGEEYQFAIEAAIKVQEVEKLANKYGVPVAILLRGMKGFGYPSREDLIRVKIERGHRRAGEFRIPDISAEVVEPGTGGALRAVIIGEITLVNDFEPTTRDPVHKVDQFEHTLKLLKDKYGVVVPIDFRFYAPDKPSRKTEEFLMDALRAEGMRNVTVTWVQVLTKSES